MISSLLTVAYIIQAVAQVYDQRARRKRNERLDEAAARAAAEKDEQVAALEKRVAALEARG